MKTIANLSLIFLFSLSLNSFAGTQAIMQQFKKGQATNEKTIISVHEHLLRMDNTGAKNSQDSSQVVFNTKKKEMLIIDHKDKTFTRMDSAMFQKINKKLQMAKKQMEAQLAKMPPEQREMMRSMMGNMMQGVTANQKNSKWIKTSRTSNVANYRCSISEYLVDGKKTREYCLASSNEFDGERELLLAMKEMSVMFRELFDSLSETLPMLKDTNPFYELEGIDGFPVSITEYNNGKVKETSKLISVKRKSFVAGFFTAPKGYKEEKPDFGT